MNNKFLITYLPLFYNDLYEIINYINFHLCNKKAANDLLNNIEEKIKKRSFNPISYQKYYSKSKRKYTYYTIHLKSYTIFYTVKDNTMEIRRILYNKRNFDKII